MLMIASVEILQHVFYIWYSVQFHKDQAGEVKVSIDSDSKVNVITRAFVAK